MTDLARTFTVESAEPGFGVSPKRHVVLTARAGESVDVVNLWTADPDLAARLVPGVQVEVLVAAAEDAPSRG